MKSSKENVNSFRIPQVCLNWLDVLCHKNSGITRSEMIRRLIVDEAVRQGVAK